MMTTEESTTTHTPKNKICRLSPQAKPCVSFLPTVMARPTLHINDYSDAEYNACFYEKTEMQYICKEVKHTLKMMSMKKRGMMPIHQGASYCTRGLESYTKEGAQLKLENRRNGWRAVFQEQMEQDKNCIQDDTKLASMYAASTCKCQAEARNKLLLGAATVGQTRYPTKLRLRPTNTERRLSVRNPSPFCQKAPLRLARAT